MDERTLAYYEKNAGKYIDRTLKQDVTSLAQSFTPLVSGPRILDAGCGSGRDLKFFARLGFSAVGLDHSLALSAFAVNYSEQPVVCSDLRRLPFVDGIFDGIWCCAAIVHLSIDECRQVFKEMGRVSVEGGVLFLSVKYGEGRFRDQDGRFFQLFTEDTIRKISVGAGLRGLVYTQNRGADGTLWLNIIGYVSKKFHKSRPLNISESLLWSKRLLKSHAVEDASLEAEWILEHALGIERVEFYRHPRRKIPRRKELDFFALIGHRMQRCPFAYLTGQKIFMEMKFKVTPHVLIPRPETEWAVRYLCEQRCDRRLFILDLGTGSGCIAVSLLKYLPRSHVVAADISEQALAVAMDNARRHRVEKRILPLCADLFSAFTPDANFDVIVSNPPYISATEYPDLMPEVRNFEPRLALVAGDGLDFYRCILAQAYRHLRSQGLLLLELGYGQLSAVRELIKPPLVEHELLRDYAGIDRILILRNGHSGENHDQ